MAKAIKSANGYKTYALAIAFTLYAAIGWYGGLLDANQAMEILQTSGLGATLRHAVASQ